MPNFSSYVSGCPLHVEVPHCVTSCLDVQLQIDITGYAMGLSCCLTRQYEAVPLCNQARSRLSSCPTGQYEAVP